MIGVLSWGAKNTARNNHLAPHGIEIGFIAVLPRTAESPNAFNCMRQLKPASERATL